MWCLQDIHVNCSISRNQKPTKFALLLKVNLKRLGIHKLSIDTDEGQTLPLQNYAIQCEHYVLAERCFSVSYNVIDEQTDISLGTSCYSVCESSSKQTAWSLLCRLNMSILKSPWNSLVKDFCFPDDYGPLSQLSTYVS